MTDRPINNPDIRYLEPQQILRAFDQHLELFKWRLRDVQAHIEVEACRQQIESLVAELNAARHVNAKLEWIFKALGINPREHQAWAEKLPEERGK